MTEQETKSAAGFYTAVTIIALFIFPPAGVFVGLLCFAHIVVSSFKK